MRKSYVRLVSLAALAATTVCLVSCARKPSAPSVTPKELSGTVRVSGAWALYPMMIRWAEEFQKLHPQVRVEVSAGGAGKGVTDALGGLVDIGMVSRSIHPEEEKRGAFWVPVVKDAVVPVCNARNPVAADLARRGLTREQFAALWLEQRDVTWGSLISRRAVTTKVRVYTRSDACGAAETWAQYLGKTQEDLGGTGVYGDPGIAEAVRKDPQGIGFNNLNYAYDTTTGRPVAGLMLVPIDINGDGRLEKAESFYGTRAELKRAIAEGVYPSPPARDLNLLTKGKPVGVTRELLTWILTNGQSFVEEAGYVTLSGQKLTAALDRLD
jgi:phosphate transport system substrate-binding protein